MQFDDLNPEQLAAVRHPGGPMRIVAGAGTGKTQTLTRRFKALVEAGILENRILVLTFSRKAAEEMQQRITSQLPGGHRKLWIQTFHSFSLALIDEWNRAAGVPAPTVIDEQEQQGYAANVVGQLAEEELHFYQGDFGRNRLSGDLLTFASQVKDCLMAPADVDAYVADREAAPGRLHDLSRAYMAYREDLDRRGLQDFGELGYQAVMRLRSDEGLLTKTRGRFDHVLVDEFQDTNLAQFELVKLLVPPGGNVCVVGDVNQAIYAFRGGNPAYISRFEEYYPGAKTFRLTTNYRSGQAVLDAANQLIRQNPDGEAITLTAHAGAGSAAVNLLDAGNPDQEGDLIAREILRLVRREQDPVRFGDIAILLRSTTRDAGPITRAMTRHGIPVVESGKATFDTEVVHDVLAALRLVAGPPTWRDAARVVARDRAKAIHLRGVESRFPDAELRDSLLERSGIDELSLSTPHGQIVADMRVLALRAAAARSLPLPELMYEALRLSGRLTEALAPETSRVLSSFIDHATKLGDSGGDAAALVAQVMAGYGDLPHQGEKPRTGVTLSTVHAAKGLEWPVVFVAAMTDGQFPLPMKLDRTFDFDDMGDWQASGISNRSEAERRERFLQEERRLAYVAFTRARNILTITYPQKDGSGRMLSASPFLEEAGLHLFKKYGEDGFAALMLDSMSDLAAYLRTRRLDADSVAISDPAAETHLAGVVLNSWAAEQNVPGVIGERRRQLPAPNDEQSRFRFSYSQLNTYQQCPRQYCYSRVLRLDETEDGEAPYLPFGTAAHSALESLNKQWLETGRVPDDDAIEATIEQFWPERGFQFASQTRQLRHRLSAMLHRYYALERSRIPPRIPLRTEFDFSMAYGSHSVSGKIDAVFESADGEVEIVDYKTSAKSTFDKLTPRDSMQLFLYDAAIRSQGENRPFSVAYYGLRHKDDKGFVTGDGWEKRQIKAITHDDESRALIAATIDELIGRIESNDFGPTPSETMCGRCAYRWLCPAG